MSDITRSRIVEALVGAIDIPASAYEKAEARYKDLAAWFGRQEARCQVYDPHIYPQGSFRLGTVIRPVIEDGEYDLDMGCRLRVGVTKANCTQKQLKELVGADLEDYRGARGIKEKREEKHRCWRLKYADTLKFHLDTVPSIPEELQRRLLIQEAIIRTGAPADLARLVADSTGAITDNRMWNYQIIDNNWRFSNSEGFAKWFESRMKQARVLLENRAREARAAKVDDLPAYQWKSPLQRCVQILKRHRDVMFVNDPDGKPASIIITTLAARAYQGETDIAEALDRILSTMGTLVNPTQPRVPNPVNPAEDFGDRWSDPASARLKLEEKFWRWLRKAQADFKSVGEARKIEMIIEQAKGTFGVSLNEDQLRTIPGLGTSGLLKAAVTPATLSFPNKPLVPQKPAGFA